MLKKLLDIVATQIFLRRIQEGSGRDAYNYICGQLHDVWDVNSALCLAKSYIHRTKSNSPDTVSDNYTFFLAEAIRNPELAKIKVKSPETCRKSQNLIRRSQLIRPIRVLISSSRWRPWLKFRQKPVYYGPMKANASGKSAILSTN